MLNATNWAIPSCEPTVQHAAAAQAVQTKVKLL
jgi:hypothetical protein